jgi:hypothetical protein
MAKGSASPSGDGGSGTGFGGLQLGSLGSSEQEIEERRRRKAQGMKKGGSVSASKRADGCAVKGKTKGAMIAMANVGKAR